MNSHSSEDDKQYQQYCELCQKLHWITPLRSQWNDLTIIQRQQYREHMERTLAAREEEAREPDMRDIW